MCKEKKVCYVCGKSIDGKYVYIGIDSEGNKLYRHDNEKCEPGSYFYFKRVKKIDKSIYPVIVKKFKLVRRLNRRNK